MEPAATPVPQPLTPMATATPSPDRTAPGLKIALKFTKSGPYAVRRTGKFGVAITLGERADLTITATARKNARSRARTILRTTTRAGVAADKPTLKLTLTRSVRAALRKGETVTLTVQARDAAGNATTQRVTAKAP